MSTTIVAQTRDRKDPLITVAITCDLCGLVSAIGPEVHLTISGAHARLGYVAVEVERDGAFVHEDRCPHCIH